MWVLLCLVCIFFGVLLTFKLDPFLRGWLRLRQGRCPLCGSDPPKNFCGICHGMPKAYNETIPEVKKLWWNSYKKIVYIRRAKKRGELH